MMEEEQPAPTDSLPTRRSLLTRLRNWDDDEGWREFHELYYDLILSVVRKSGVSGADAEEVAQEALISVAKGMKEFRYNPERGSFKGWLKTIVRSRLVDFFRRQARRRTTPLDENTAPEEASDSEPLNELDAHYEREWSRHLLEQALRWLQRRIPARQFAVFDLCVLQEQPVPEVARLLGMNRGLIYVTKHRAARLLKQRLEVLRTEMEK